MSIKLQVEEYCQNCPDFEARIEKTELNGFGGAILTETIITCKDARRCQRIAEHLKSQSDPINFRI